MVAQPRQPCIQGACFSTRQVSVLPHTPAQQGHPSCLSLVLGKDKKEPEQSHNCPDPSGLQPFPNAPRQTPLPGTYFIPGEAEDQRRQGPWSRCQRVGDAGPEHRAPASRPHLGVGRKVGIAQRAGRAEGAALGSARKGPELGLHRRGRDVSHPPCDPGLQTKAGRELFLGDALCVRLGKLLESGGVPPT